MRPSRRLAVVLSVIGLLAGSGVVFSATPASAAEAFGSGTPSFVTTNNPDTGSYAGEPSLGINQVTGNGMFISGTSVFKVGFNPSSGAATWSDATPLGSFANLDPILSTDPKTGVTLAGGDTGACSGMFRSTDDGASWTPALPCTFTLDHPTVAWAPSALTPGDRVWYYCQQQSFQACSTSTDGGSTWLPGVPMTNLDCEHVHGHLRGSADGTAYLPSYVCFDANGNQRVGGVLTRDDGASWQGYTIPTATQTSSSFDPAVGTTPDNTVYQAWSDATYQPMIAWSTDHAATWSTSVNLSNWSSTPFTATTFPTLATGDNGRVAYTFVGTSTPVPSGQSPFSAGFQGVWYLYTAYTYDRGASWTVVKDRSTPIQVGEIDAGGTTSSLGQRNLEDFIDSNVTKDGRVVVGFADGCLAACQTDMAAATPNLAQATADSMGGVGAVSYQLTGKGLYSAYDGSGGPVTPPPPPTGTACPGGRAGFLDKAGDANEVVITGTTPGPSDPALDLLDGSVGWDAATSTAVFRARISDLTKAPLSGDGYYRWQVSFGSDAQSYQLFAQIPNPTTSLPGQGSAPSYGLFDSAANSTVVSQDLTGSVNASTGVVEIDLSSAQFRAAKPGNPALSGTTPVKVSAVLAQRASVVATLTADTGDSTCNGTLAPPATVPAAPSLTATGGAGAVALSWTAPADGGSPITGYTVERGTVAGTRTTLATVAAGVTSYSDPTATPGTTYVYAVRAVNAVGAGPASVESSASAYTTPDAPTVTARGGTGSVILSWAAPGNGGNPISGYVIERGTAAGARTALATIAADATSYTDTGLAAGATRFYAVRAVNAAGSGAASNEVSATTSSAPSAPTLTAQAGTNKVTLGWTVPADGGSAITGYTVLRRTALGSSATLATVPAGTTSYVDSGAVPGTAYWYAVQATNAVGAGTASSEASATAYTTAAAPTLSATGGKGQVSLSWSAPANGGQPITGYRIFRGTRSGGETLIQTISSGTTYVDSTTAGGTPYWYQVVAITSAGDGARSNEVTATPKK